MVLETIESVRDAVRNPWHMVLFGAAISFVSLGVAKFTFPQNAGLLTVFLITVISTPFMLNLLRYEESREERKLRGASLLQRLNPISAFARQSEIFVIYSAFFVGVIIALTLSFIFLPQDVAESTFNDQVSQIGKISLIFGKVASGGLFGQILFNNLIVLAMSFLFALLFGVGAIFILAWNASILSAAIGIVTKGSGLTEALRVFLPHGVFEIAAYFVAGIAGGIISVAVSKRGTKEFGSIVSDMSVLIVLSVALIFIGAFIESASAI